MTTTVITTRVEGPVPAAQPGPCPEGPAQGPASQGPAPAGFGDQARPKGPAEVTALRVQARQRLEEAARVRTTGDRLSLALWAVAGMALAFTMANVTTFATSHDTPWWIGWLLDPMASLALLVVLIGDGVLARHGQRSGGWARALKHGSALATWSMNAWTSVVAGDPAGIVLHSVPPALVIGLSEATPTYRAKFAELAERLQGEAVALQVRADQLEADTRAQAARTPDAPAIAEPVAEPAPDRTLDRTPDRTLDRTLDRTPDRTLGEGSGRRTLDRTPDRTPAEESGEGSGGRRSEEELLVLVEAAIAEGRLPARPSGTAIQRVLGGGKRPAMRVAARLAAPEDADGDAQDGDAAVIQLVHDRAEVAS